MVLHRQSVEFLAQTSTGKSVADPTFGYQDIVARRVRERAEAMAMERVQVAHVDDLDAAGVACRLYRPRDDAPTIVHLHGGGWVFGDLDTHDAFSRYLADRTGCAVLAVGYRRAPEDPYPAALDDCETASEWLTVHGKDLGVRPGRAVVLGDSAGGNLAAALAIRHPDWFAAQVLIYPCLDPTGSTGSYRTEVGGLTGAEMTWYWDAYAPDHADREADDVAPAGSRRLAGLPPTLVITAEHDPVRDEGEAFAGRLAEAGALMAAVRHLGMVHGFWRHPQAFDASAVAVGQVSTMLHEIALTH
jgi:acetyl esterase